MTTLRITLNGTGDQNLIEYFSKVPVDQREGCIKELLQHAIKSNGGRGGFAMRAILPVVGPIGGSAAANEP